MDPNMTGEPNQEHSVHPSVFSFEPYPPPQPIIWNQANPFANSQLIPSTTNSFFQQISVPQSPVAVPQFGGTSLPPPANMLENTIQVHNANNFAQGFSFGSPQVNEGVVQFPFQISQSNHEFAHKPIRYKRKTDSPP